MIISVKNMMCLAVIVVVFGGAAIFGLKEIVPAKSVSQSEIEAIVYPLKLAMKLEKTEYNLGEPITVNLLLTNIGNSTVTLDFTSASPLTWLRFKVYDTSDVLVFTSSFATWAIGQRVFLDPSSFIGQVHEWDQMDDYVQPLKTGNYKIIGFLDDLYNFQITLETPPILISIV